MKVLYVSALSSERLINELYNKRKINPGFALQKFARLIVKGMRANGAEVSTLTNPPIVRNVLSRLYISISTEEENGILYKYIPFINIPIIKHLCVIIYSFFYTLLWGIKNKREKLLFCDVINVSACVGTLLAAKILNLKTACIVTDIYGMMVGEKKGKFSNFITICARKFYNIYANSFDRYVLLTEQMNEKINFHKKPYIVMEAICDEGLNFGTLKDIKKDNPRTIIYAGGLYEQYGVKMLVDGFLESGVDAKLILYGSGSFVKELNDNYSRYTNVEYRGVVSNNEIMEKECRASLLINPRFSSEEFTKYSFPSKNMEYMASGTPLLTNNLSGMPVEYKSYVYIFEDETISGYAKSIKKVLSYSEEELYEFGLAAKKFVLEKKNYKIQGAKIMKLLNE